MDRTDGKNTLKLYYDEEKWENFMNSAQAEFWAVNGHPSKEMSPDDCRLVSPYLSSILPPFCNYNPPPVMGFIPLHLKTRFYFIDQDQIDTFESNQSILVKKIDYISKGMLYTSFEMIFRMIKFLY